MRVLVTGAFGRIGTALIANQSSEFDYRYVDREPHPSIESIVADISEYSSLEQAFDGHCGVVHLAAASSVDADWKPVLENNIIGTYNCLQICREQQISTVVLASSNHVVGMYEDEHAPDLYSLDHDLLLDHRTPVRPDSHYGSSKVFTEVLGRYYVENYEYPKQVYALRIGSVRDPEYDHPYGDAERGVENGQWERGSEAYDRSVRRMKATWQSRRDVAQLIERCLADDNVEFDIFYGISDNERRWLDLDHARTVLGYDPQDVGEAWDSPPSDQRGEVDY
jgi:nucleoside-diphosphate-sugar epimerase